MAKALTYLIGYYVYYEDKSQSFLIVLLSDNCPSINLVAKKKLSLLPRQLTSGLVGEEGKMFQKCWRKMKHFFEGDMLGGEPVKGGRKLELIKMDGLKRREEGRSSTVYGAMKGLSLDTEFIALNLMFCCSMLP